MARILLGLIFLFIVGCGEVYLGPLRDKPIRNSEGDTNVKVITLWETITSQPVPEPAVDQAFKFFDENRGLIRNQNWLSIIDFNQHSSQPRLYVINLNDGNVDQLFVAHGSGSDPNDTGSAQQFSNIFESYMSSLGFYLINESYIGKWGLSARLDGLSDSNSNARERAIVLHGADYVGPGRDRQGMSQGCPAVELRWIEPLIQRLRGRSLLYAYHSQVDLRP